MIKIREVVDHSKEEKGKGKAETAHSSKDTGKMESLTITNARESMNWTIGDDCFSGRLIMAGCVK